MTYENQQITKFWQGFDTLWSDEEPDEDAPRRAADAPPARLDGTAGSGQREEPKP